MSAFATNSSLPGLMHDPEPIRAAKEAATDALVARTRAATPPAILNQRDQKRMSVAEMNATDWDSIRDRFLSTRRDDRGPVTRFLDLLDMPRNQLYAHLAPGLEKKARMAGNVGSFGTGSVHFSDVLGEAGMKPGVIRAALGLVGDVFTDPLILLGPIGGGIKTVTAGGRALETTVRGVRAVGTAAKELKAGRAISNPIVKAVADAAGTTTGLKGAIFGGVAGKNTLLGRTVQRGGKLLRETSEHEGGLIGKYGDAVAPAGTAEAKAIDATQAFHQQYGRGTSPGIRFGRDAAGNWALEASAGGAGKVKNATSSYLHIPFTDIGIHGPPISSGARTAAGMLALSAAERIGVAATDTDRLKAARDSAKLVTSAADEWKNLAQQEASFRAANADSVARIEGLGGNQQYPLLASVDTDRAVQDTLAGFAARKAALADQIKAGQDALWQAHGATETDLAPRSIGSVLSLIKATEEIDAAAALSAAQESLLRHDLTERGGVLKRISDRQSSVAAPFERLAALDTKEKGSSEPVIRALLGQDAAGRTVLNADPNVQAAAMHAMAPALDEYEAAVAALDKARATKRVDEEDIARSMLVSARERLYAATEPLRTGSSFHTIDDLKEAVKARETANLSQSKLDLLNLGDADEKAMQELADAHHQAMKASVLLASATNGSVMQWLNKGQVGLLDSAQGFLGTSDAIQGASVFSPMSAAIKAAFPRQADIAIELAERGSRYKRFLIGQKEGIANDVARRAHRAMDAGSRIAAERMYGQLESAMRKIALDHGIPSSEIPELLDIATALAYQMRDEQAGRQIAAGRSVGTSVPAGYLQRIEEAKGKGYLNPAQHNGLAIALRDYARRFPAMMDDLGDIERAAGIERGARDYHLSKVTTPLAEKTIAQARKNKFGNEAVQAARVGGLEQFQKSITTDHITFPSRVTGKDETIFDMDRWVQTLDDKAIDSISDPVARQEAHRLKKVLNEYDSLPNQPPMLAADPEEMNQYIREGRFSLMLGKQQYPGQFFETNMASIMAGRMGAHERAMSRQFMSDYRESMKIPVTKGTIEKALNSGRGTVIELGNGAQGRVVPLGGGVNGVRIGPDIVRPLQSKYANNLSNPVIKSLGPEGIEAFYPEKVAEAIEKFASIHDSEPIARELLTALDKATAVWKTVTLMHPSWFIFNMVGDTINFWMSDPHYLKALGKYGPAAIKASWLGHDPELISKAKLGYNIDGKFHSASDIRNILSTDGVNDANQLNEVAATLHRDGFLSMPSMYGSVGKSATRQAFRQDFEAALRFQAAAGRPGSKLRAAGSVLSNRAGRYFYGPWFRFNQQAADVLRTVAYLSYRDQGIDHAGAVYKTIRAGFDYSDMNRVERDVFKRMLPFYAYLRNNGGYQVQTLLRRPMYTASFPLLQHAIEEAATGQDQIPMTARPGWMREQLALMVGRDQQNRMALTLGSGLPQEQALVLGKLLGGEKGLQDFGNYFLSSLNPVIRAPAEFFAGKEFYTDRTIGPGGDISGLEQAANQIRPLREGRKLVETFQKQGLGGGLTRLALGGRAQPADDERLRVSKLREYKAEEERIRRQIATAGYRNDAKASVRARANQLALYRDMITAGFESDTPVWAREQLSQLAAGPAS